MMSWIAWIHDLVGACDSDGVTVQDQFLVSFVSSQFGDLGFTWYENFGCMSVDLEDLHVGDGFYDAIGDSVPQLSDFCWH